VQPVGATRDELLNQEICYTLEEAEPPRVHRRVDYLSPATSAPTFWPRSHSSISPSAEAAEF
jgi:hypothetical protein